MVHLTAEDMRVLVGLGQRARTLMAAGELRDVLAAADSDVDEWNLTPNPGGDIAYEQLRAAEIDLLLEASTTAATLGETERADAYIAQARALIEDL